MTLLAAVARICRPRLQGRVDPARGGWRYPPGGVGWWAAATATMPAQWGIEGKWDKWVKLGKSGQIGGLIEAGEEVSNTVLKCLNKSDSSSSSSEHHALQHA